MLFYIDFINVETFYSMLAIITKYLHSTVELVFKENV